MQRRQFVKSAAIGLGAVASGAGLSVEAPAQQVTREARPQKMDRIVRAVSIGFQPGLPLDSMAELVDQEGAKGADLIALPETCRGLNDTSSETLDGPTITAMARLAAKHGTYIVCPIDRKDGAGRHNSSVLIDRRGQVACVYNKLYPVWQDECTKNEPVLPGSTVCVHNADFGKIGLAICFDVNWMPLWEQLSNHGAELVVWSSAYPAGRSLQAPAILHNYYIMSATWPADCQIFDINGERIVHDQENTGKGINITRHNFDLDRCIFHQDLNRPDKRAKLIKERGDDVEEEKWEPSEGWFILRAKRPGVSARELARQYGLEELRHYINRSRCEIDKCRGFEFS